MRSMQEQFFLAGWVKGTVCLLTVLIFVTEEYNIQKNENIAERQKKNLI